MTSELLNPQAPVLVGANSGPVVLSGSRSVHAASTRVAAAANRNNELRAILYPLRNVPEKKAQRQSSIFAPIVNSA